MTGGNMLLGHEDDVDDDDDDVDDDDKICTRPVVN